MKKLCALFLCLLVALSLATACASQDKPLTAGELLSLGEKYLLETDYEQALVHFTKLIEIEPMNPRGYTGAAEAYVALGEDEKALEVLQQGLAHTADSAIEEMLAQLTASPEPEPTEIPAPTATPESSEEPAPEPTEEATPEPASTDEPLSETPEETTMPQTPEPMPSGAPITEPPEEASATPVPTQTIAPTEEPPTPTPTPTATPTPTPTESPNIALLQKLYALLDAGNVDGVIAIAMTGELRAVGTEMYSPASAGGAMNGKGVGVYHGNYVYFGDYVNGQRSGNGMWITAYGGVDHDVTYQDVFEGRWANDKPNGNGKWVRTRNYTRSGITATYTGTLADGMWQTASVVEEASDTDHIEYGSITNGYWNVISISEPDDERDYRIYWVLESPDGNPKTGYGIETIQRVQYVHGTND